MKTRLTIILLLFMSQSFAQNKAQKYGNVWQLGDQMGLDFNNCEPVVIQGADGGFEGYSSVSDSTGKLLFYTNSAVIWNANNEIMPNGWLNQMGVTLSQVIIIPKPESNHIYYVITTQVQGSENPGLKYYEVDMSANMGLGDVTGSKKLMSTFIVTEQVAATYHSNGTDIWLMTHEYGTNGFFAFKVTSSGIDLNPVISSVGPSHVNCSSNTNARGELKFSPDGSRLAFSGNGVGSDDATNILCLLDFDNRTGLVSNPINLPFSRGDFGLSFSPDNSKLYGTTWKALNFGGDEYNYLYQFDLSGGDAGAIINSKKIIDSTLVPSCYGTLKIGPDAKIYVRHTYSDYLGVINQPNRSGALCDYDKEGLYIGTKNLQFGLNNYIEYTDYCNGFSVTPPVPTEKHLVRVVDVLGRELGLQAKDRTNMVLIYIYSDFSTEKVYRLE